MALTYIVGIRNLETGEWWSTSNTWTTDLSIVKSFSNFNEGDAYADANLPSGFYSTQWIGIKS